MGINYPNTSWRIVSANSSDDALMTDDILCEGKTSQAGELLLTAEESKLILVQYNKRPGYLWIVNNNIAYQLQFSTLDKGNSLKAKIQAARAMGYHLNTIKEQNRFLKAVENDSFIKKNQLVDSIKK